MLRFSHVPESYLVIAIPIRTIIWVGCTLQFTYLIVLVQGRLRFNASGIIMRTKFSFYI